MRILVLGAAAGGGFPQWNSNSDNCRRARAGDPAVPAQTQSSLAVSADGQRWFLLNASPDIRQQIFDNAPLHPRDGLRHTPIAGVVLTNGDVDHVAGLLSLRERQPFSLYATPRIHQVLNDNPIFRVLADDVVARRPFALEKPFALAAGDGAASGITVEAFAVPGKVALYLEDAGKGDHFGSVEEDTVGLKLTEDATGRHFFYIPGCAAMTDELAARLNVAPLVFFDGTLWEDDEMIAQGVGEKTGRRMGHMSMAGPDGSIAAFSDLGVERRIFIHVNNTNPVLNDGAPERKELDKAGWELARDGMEIAL